MTSAEKFGQSVYNASSELGSITSKIYLGIAIVIAIVLVVIGIVLFSKNQSNLIDDTANITAITYCNKNPKSQNYDCEITVNYNVDNKTYTKKIQTTSKLFTIGQNIDITYDSTNPNNATEKITRYKTLSYILFGIAILIVSISSVNYYLTSKSKLYSAALGAESAMSIF